MHSPTEHPRTPHQARPEPGRAPAVTRRHQTGRASAETNARLTATTGIVLLILLALEVSTVVLGVRSHLALHITVGLLLVPPALLKFASVTWRLLSYYRGVSAYRERGTPAMWLRVLGPGLVVAMLLVLTSGIVLAVGPSQLHATALHVHNFGFYTGLLAVAAHLYGHLAEAVRVAARGLARRSPHVPSSARVAGGAVVASLLLGAVLAVILAGRAAPYLQHYHR